MTSSTISSGALVTLKELSSSSPHFKEGASLRVNGKLQDYNVETAIGILNDGGATLKVDTQHLNLNLRISSIYQFIGELHIHSPNEAVLKARVGRNVDGIDLNLYYQSLKLLREFQADQIRVRHLRATCVRKGSCLMMIQPTECLLNCPSADFMKRVNWLRNL